MTPFPVIRNFKRYFWRKVIPGLLIAIAGIFFLNFFLAYQLEMTLKKEVKERVAVATDGFYSLTFENLSIHLLNGELKIEGIRLFPDSLHFEQWQAKDSLPLTYLEASIQKIDFKGVNLIWLRNYRKLNFRSFEIANPVIHVVDAYYSDRHVRKVPVKRSKTLHEFIEPYIDVLSVDHLNIENAYFSFLVEHPFTPILYRIDDIDLHTYHFQLDSSSFANGKLLYSDHFEFISDRPQTLISNNQFKLISDTILVNTQDSLLYLKDIRLTQNNDSDIVSSGYIEGMISSVLLDGAAFKRENAFNSLYAHSFRIDSSAVHIVQETQNPSSKQDTTTEKTGVSSLSLYDLVAPVLKKVDIKTVDVEKSSFRYSTLSDDPDSLDIGKIEIHARNFLIDSIYEKKHGLWYSNQINLGAENISAHLPSQNQSFQLDSLEIDTEKGLLHIRNAAFHPVSDKKLPYITGRMDEGLVSGFSYQQGISLEQVVLDKPNLTIYQPSAKQKKNTGDPSFPEPAYIGIQNLWLNQGTLRIYQGRKQPICNLYGMQAYVENLYWDQRTPKKAGQTGLSYNKLELNLPRGNHFIVLDNYRLQLEKTSYSSGSGILHADNVAVTTLQQAGSTQVDPTLTLTIPSLQVTGLQEIGNMTEDIKINAVSIADPSLTIRKRKGSSTDSIRQKTEELTPFQPFRTLEIDQITLSGTHIDFQDLSNKTEMQVAYQQLNMDDVQWNLAENRILEIGNFRILSPHVGWKTESYDTLTTHSGPTKTIPEILYPYADRLQLHHLSAENVLLHAGQPYLKADLDIRQVSLDSLNWFFGEGDKTLSTNRISIVEPDVRIQKQPVPPTQTEKQKNDSIKTSIYDQLKILGNEIRVHDIELAGGEIFFEQAFTQDSGFSQKINKTDFRLEELAINNEQQTIQYENIHLLTQHFSYPIDNGFYTLETDRIEINNQDIEVTNFHMNPRYEKGLFAYIHPKHTDWFDVTFDRLYIKEFDFMKYVSDNLLYIKEVTVDNPLMLNFKNKQIYVPPRWMPMIYAGLQKAPLDINIEKIRVNNFGIVYEELAKNKPEPGRLVITELNGNFTGVTNIVSHPEQYIRLDADGKFYGDGHFNAVWLLPVDSLNDRFILQAHLPDMDLTLFNEMIRPMAYAELKGGHLNDFQVVMDAGSVGGSIDMLLLYNGLKVNIFGMNDGIKKDKKFLNFLANAVVRDNNPNTTRSKPRQASDTIIRDPYHSSFNYLWQLLRPALVESVGISKTQQKIAIGISNFITKVKKLFGKGKKEEEPTPVEMPPMEEIPN